MLSQDEADILLNILKRIRAFQSPFTFPSIGDSRQIELVSDDGRHEFIVDVNRKGYLGISKRCTYQGRYRKDIILLRLDIAGPEHTNPDGTRVSGNHLHIYQEGYGDEIAIEIPPEIVNPDDLYQTLIDFLLYFKTIDADLLQIQMVI